MERDKSGQSERQPTPRHELERIAGERLGELQRSGEHDGSRQREDLESAREKLRDLETPSPQAEAAPTAEPVSQRILTKAENYRQTMVTLRHRMKPAARQFSKLIHTPSVEAASEIVGKTVLRPSVSLGATATAVLLTTFIYFYARYYGFELRGSEIWLTLIAGGCIGLIGEATYKAWRRLRGHS